MSSFKSTLKALALCFLISTSCNYGSQTSNNQTKNRQFLTDGLGEKITKDFEGIVLNEAKNPIEGAVISIGNKNTYTDSKGRFRIEETNINAHFAYLVAYKSNYNTYEKSINLQDNSSFIKITLIEIDEYCLHWFCKHNHNLP